MIREEHTIERLRGLAHKLTSDPRWQRELISEMHSFLQQKRAQQPGLKTILYVKMCEEHGRRLLTVRKGPGDSPPSDEAVIARLDPEQVRERLSPRQAEVFHHLRRGRGIREIARLLGISHPAVIKLRRKIVRNAKKR